MVVHNLDFKSVCIDPPEADAPLVVDPNAVLPLAVTGKGLQAIAWDGSQIRQGRSRMNVVEFAFRHQSNGLELSAELAPKHLLGLLVSERPDHTRLYYRVTFNAIR